MKITFAILFLVYFIYQFFKGLTKNKRRDRKDESLIGES